MREFDLFSLKIKELFEAKNYVFVGQSDPEHI